MSATLIKALRIVGGHSATLALLAVCAAVVTAGLAAGIAIADWIWMPAAGLFANLVAAIVAYPALRTQRWLYAFHVVLAALIVVILAERLTALRGSVELTEGQVFTADAAELVAGPLHFGRIDEVAFAQGGFEIRYAPGMKRRETYSTVRLPDGAGEWVERKVGDEHPLVLAGYRFYTTFNKGFAPVITFTGSDGLAVTGSIHLPSYPLNEHMQANEWTPPGADAPVGLWLSIDEPVYDEVSDWRFSRPENPELVAIVGDDRRPMRVGEAVEVPGGTLRFEELRVWMGYSIVSNSLVPWMMTIALTAVACLFVHIVLRLRSGGRARRAAATIGGGLANAV